jgi:GT2 family glycosyltransferase
MSFNNGKLIPIVILNWNGLKDTVECLESLKDSDYLGYIPILVDNGSTEHTFEELVIECSKVFSNLFVFDKGISNLNKSEVEVQYSAFQNTLIVVKSTDNLGFAKGNNIGIDIASKLESEWVLLLNNDTILEKMSLRNLMEFISKHPKYIAVTPQIRYEADKNIIWNCGGNLTLFGSRKYYFAEQSFEVIPNVDYQKITFITGCALLYNFKIVGNLSELYFFGEEDYELSLRINKINYEMACVFDSVIYHKVGSSIKKNSKILGHIYIHYISRLINTKNYYSYFRWLLTKYLSYLYLPILLFKSRLNPLKSVLLIKKIELFIRKNKGVDKNEFIKTISMEF